MSELIELECGSVDMTDQIKSIVHTLNASRVGGLGLFSFLSFQTNCDLNVILNKRFQN